MRRKCLNLFLALKSKGGRGKLIITVTDGRATMSCREFHILAGSPFQPLFPPPIYFLFTPARANLLILIIVHIFFDSIFVNIIFFMLNILLP